MSLATSRKGKERATEPAHMLSGAIEDDASNRTSKDSEDSESDSSSSENESSDYDSDFAPTDPAFLESLLEKAKENMATKAAQKKKAVFSEQEEIRLDDGIEEVNGDSNDHLPRLDPGPLPPRYIEWEKNNKAGPSTVRDIDTDRLEKAVKAVSVPALPPPATVKKDGSKLTRKERKTMKEKTAGPGWFDLPAPDAAELPRLYREVEALRLRNQLDPKRFYRKDEGEGKGIKGLPKHFAIGTIIASSTPFGTRSTDNLTHAERKRTIVDELVDDAEAKRYAKRKFLELQGVRGAKGRGTLAKKKAARKMKW